MRLTLLALPLLLATATVHAESKAADGRASLEVNQAGNLLIGTVELNRNGRYRTNDVDVITLPECDESANRPVNAIRFAAPMTKRGGGDNGAASIESFALIFNNGTTQETQVREVLRNAHDNDGTRWFELKGGMRCIRAVAVVGAQRKDDSRRAQGAEIRVMGRR